MSRPTAWLAWSLYALSLASVIVWASFRILNSPTPRGINQTPLLFEMWGLLVFVLFTTVGALVASRRCLERQRQKKSWHHIHRFTSPLHHPARNATQRCASR